MRKKWITIHASPKRGSDLAIFHSKTVTTMFRHVDQDERESDGSRHWESIGSVLVRKFAYEGARDFSDEMSITKVFLKAHTKKELSTVKKRLSCMFLRAIQGHSGVISIEFELMGHVVNTSKLGKVLIPQKTLMELPVHIGKSTDSRRKREKKSPSGILSHTNESLWKLPEGRRPS